MAALWVTLGGVALAIGVNLYFFSPRRAVVARPAPAPGEAPQAGAGGATIAAVAGPQEVRITVRGGYEPARIEVRAGQPVRLVFRREEVEGCSDTVLMPEWGIAKHLPAHEDTAVEFTPMTPGEYEFTCGMHMLRGTVVVK